MRRFIGYGDAELSRHVIICLTNLVFELECDVFPSLRQELMMLLQFADNCLEKELVEYIQLCLLNFGQQSDIRNTM